MSVDVRIRPASFEAELPNPMLLDAPRCWKSVFKMGSLTLTDPDDTSAKSLETSRLSFLDEYALAEPD